MLADGVEVWRRRSRGNGKKLRGQPEREFLFRLALALGVWDVDALAASMPMPLVLEWMAYYIRAPFGDEWRRTGRLAGIVAAAAGAKVDGDLEEHFLPTGGRATRPYMGKWSLPSAPGRQRRL